MSGVFQPSIFQRAVFQQEDAAPFLYGGVGHYLYEREKARQLAAITRPTPRPIDRRTMPRMEPLARPYSAPIAPAPVAPPVQPDRVAAAAAQAQATKKRRDMEALLLLAS